MKLGEFELNKIYQGDCLELLPKLPDNSVDLVLTDPPYLVSGNKLKWDKKDYVSISHQEWSITDEKEYFKLMRIVINECLRVLKKGGRLIIFEGYKGVFQIKKYF